MNSVHKPTIKSMFFFHIVIIINKNADFQ